MRKLQVAFSGGRTSAMMCKLLLEHPAYQKTEKLFLFANTGKEREETLKFVDQVDRHFGLGLIWLEAKVNPKKRKATTWKQVTYETASRNGEPFEDVIRKYGIPNKHYRHCTRELKLKPMTKYTQSLWGKEYHTALGIRADEPHRLKRGNGRVYPLADLNIDEITVRRFWERQPFDLELKDYQGNCDLCFLKSNRKKKTVIAEDPQAATWWLNMEETYGTDKLPIFDTLRMTSMKEWIERAKEDFTHAMDKHEMRKAEGYNFDLVEDFELDCFCKNT